MATCGCGQASKYGPANREAVLMLDDLLIGDEGMVPLGADSPTHALMGRFGNTLLVNGEPSWHLEVKRGEVVRFFFTNAGQHQDVQSVLSRPAVSGAGGERSAQ